MNAIEFFRIYVSSLPDVTRFLIAGAQWHSVDVDGDAVSTVLIDVRAVISFLSNATTWVVDMPPAQSVPLVSDAGVILDRSVRNPMKMSDIGYLKTEQNRTDLKIQKPKTQLPQFGFQKIDFGGLGTVFHLS